MDMIFIREKFTETKLKAAIINRRRTSRNAMVDKSYTIRTKGTPNNPHETIID